MVSFLYYAHSGTRWLVVLATVIAFLFMLFSLFTNREQDRATRSIMMAFSSLIGLQWVLGLLLYILYAAAVNDYGRLYWVEHLTVMTVVLIVAHLYLPFRRRASTRTYYIASTIIILVVVALVILGVSFLPGDRWSMQPLYAPAL